MSHPIIAVGSDHAGYALKALLADDLRSSGFEVIDCGTHNEDQSVDYPDFGAAVAAEIASGRAQLGLLVCGSGVGISIAANRNPQVRAALCTSGLMARLAREHNDANILALGSRIIGVETARECLAEFLTTEFAGGRHAGRVAKLSQSILTEVNP